MVGRDQTRSDQSKRHMTRGAHGKAACPGRGRDVRACALARWWPLSLHLRPLAERCCCWAPSKAQAANRVNTMNDAVSIGRLPIAGRLTKRRVWKPALLTSMDMTYLLVTLDLRFLAASSLTLRFAQSCGSRALAQNDIRRPPRMAREYSNRSDARQARQSGEHDWIGRRPIGWRPRNASLCRAGYSLLKHRCYHAR